MIHALWATILISGVFFIGVCARRVRAARLVHRAQRQISVGENQEALVCLSRAIGLDATISLAYALRSQLLLRSGVIERALDDAEEAVRLAPNSHHSRLARARLYNYLGQYMHATRDLEIAVEHNPTWRTGYLELAHCCLLLGDYEGCVTVLERLAGQVDAGDPLLYDALVMAGWVREASLRDVDAAIEFYSRAIGVAPDRRVGYLQRGWALRARGEYEKAAEDLLRAAQRPQRSEDLRLHHWLQAQPSSWLDAVAAEFGGHTDWVATLQRLLLEETDGAFDALPLLSASEPQIYLN